MDDVLTTGYKDLLDKTQKFLEKQGRGRDYKHHCIPVNGESVHLGIKFIYPFFDNDEKIGIDLFLSPKFSKQSQLLSGLQEIKDIEKREM